MEGPALQDRSSETVLAHVDFTSGEPCGTIELSGGGLARNGQDPTSIVFHVQWQSQLTCRFTIDEIPAYAFVALEHLSSAAAAVPNGGRSPIRVSVNGHVVCASLDPGSLGFVTDRIHITKYLRRGVNTIEIQLLDSDTNYWLRRLEVHGY